MILYANFGINFMENGQNRFSANSGLEVVGKLTYKAGQAELHCEPNLNKYYLRIGTPDQRIGVMIGVPNVATVQTTAYFMMGTEVPASLPPPAAVTTILRSAGQNPDFSMMRNRSALAKGNGMAFGTNLSVGIIYHL
jgi:hypothetical protein